MDPEDPEDPEDPMDSEDRMNIADAYTALGLDSGASLTDVRAARRRLAAVHHPDRGGDERRMQEINTAAERLIAHLRDGTARTSAPTGTTSGPGTGTGTGADTSAGTRTSPGSPPDPAPTTGTRPPSRPPPRSRPWPSRAGGRRRIDHDDPSFTLDVPPADAYAALLRALGSIGELVDGDPPYRMECRLEVPSHCWCALDLLPAAGASTSVSLTIVHDRDDPTDAEDVRDVWIEILNRPGEQRL